MIVSDDDAPVDAQVWLESMEDKGNADVVRKVADKSSELLNELTEKTPGRESGMLRALALNFCVPGETYLAEAEDEWLILSPEELISTGGGYQIRRSRMSTKGQGDTKLDRRTRSSPACSGRHPGGGWSRTPRWSPCSTSASSCSSSTK